MGGSTTVEGKSSARAKKNGRETTAREVNQEGQAQGKGGMKQKPQVLQKVCS